MNIPTIAQVMREQATFVKYRDGKLWYQITWSTAVGSTPNILDFPIELNDSGDGEFKASEKAVTLMRWIRKHIEYLKLQEIFVPPDAA